MKMRIRGHTKTENQRFYLEFHDELKLELNIWSFCLRVNPSKTIVVKSLLVDE